MPEPLPNVTYIQNSAQQAPKSALFQPGGFQQVVTPFGVTASGGANQVSPVAAQGREALLAPYRANSAASQVFNQPGATWGQYYGSMATPNLPAANMDTRMIQMVGDQKIRSPIPQAGGSATTGLIGLAGAAAPFIAGGVLSSLLGLGGGGASNTTNTTPSNGGNIVSGAGVQNSNSSPFSPGSFAGIDEPEMPADWNGFYSPSQLTSDLNSYLQANPNALNSMGAASGSYGPVAIATSNATGGQGGAGGQGGSATVAPNINISQNQSQSQSQQLPTYMNPAYLQGGVAMNVPTGGGGYVQNPTMPITVGQLDQRWANFYDAEAKRHQDAGRFQQALNDAAMAQKLRAQGGMYPGSAAYGYDPTLPVYNPYLPENYSPTYIGVRPLYGTGDPNYFDVPDDQSSFTPGFVGGVLGLPNNSGYGGPSGSQIDAPGPYADTTGGVARFAPIYQSPPVAQPAPANLQGTATPFTNTWAGGNAPAGYVQTAAPTQPMYLGPSGANYGFLVPQYYYGQGD